jgi:hypothetical protein
MTHLTEAIIALDRSLEANGSLLRSDYCLVAAGHLRRAGLHGHAELAAALAEVYHGDGCGVRRLHDELCALEARARAFGADSGFTEAEILAGLVVPVLVTP